MSTLGDFVSTVKLAAELPPGELKHCGAVHSTLPKIWRVRRLIEQSKPECSLEVDGGIDAETAPLPGLLVEE
jgi:Ribulose-phosphate 3 epimerase family